MRNGLDNADLAGTTGSGGSAQPTGPATSAIPASSASSGASGVSLGDSSVTAGLVANARSGDDHFLYGDDRAITNPPNWHSQRSTELYQGATMNNDPSTAQAAAQDWVAQADRLKEVADDLYRAITDLGAVWVGHGAGAAQGALVGIATSGSQAGSAARVMGDRMSRQAEAAAEVKKMPPPKEFDPDQASKAALAGGPAAMVADMKAQRDAAQAVKEEQVRYFNAYTAAMTDVDRSTPSFGPESLGLKGASGSGTGASGAVGAVGGSAPVGGRHLAAPAAGGHGVSPVGAAGAAVPGSGAPAAAAAAPAPAASVDTPATSSAGFAPSAGTGAAQATAAPTPTTDATPAAASGGAAALGGAVVGGGLGFAGSKLAAGRQTGAVRKDSDESEESEEYTELDAAGDSGDDPADEETEVASQRSAAAAPAGSPGAGAVSSSGTVGGAATPVGAPMAGAAGAGGGGSDEGHTHASFLIEPDPDDIFGANQATAPPVIGEWIDDDA